MRILYVTADGILEPLGFSQVVRVVEGLVRRGLRYDILSLEKERDLARRDRVAQVEARLGALGIRWLRVPYDWSSSARAAVNNLAALTRETVRAARSGTIGAVHARAYHGAVAGFAASTAGGTPYVFDARSYWIDERLEEGRWFTTPLRLGLARGLEHQLFARAAGVVTLTELQADDVRSGRFGPPAGPVVCVPTTADYDDFRPRRERSCPACRARCRRSSRASSSWASSAPSTAATSSTRPSPWRATCSRSGPTRTCSS